VEKKKNILTKIQSFSERKKKVITIVAVFVLAVPLTIFVLQDIKKAVKEFDRAKIEEGLNLKELKVKLKENTINLKGEFEQLKIPTSTISVPTSTFSTTTTTTLPANTNTF